MEEKEGWREVKRKRFRREGEAKNEVKSGKERETILRHGYNDRKKNIHKVVLCVVPQTAQGGDQHEEEYLVHGHSDNNR